MSDKDKFEGFKKEMIEENERKHGEEVREKYGDEAVDRSNEMLSSMTKEQHEEHRKLTGELYATLAEAFAAGDPAGELAQRAAGLHKEWLSFYWNEYTPQAHAGLADMYVQDDRFRAHYDEKQPGTAAFLRDAIRIYTGMNS